MAYSRFIFESYRYDRTQSILSLRYGYDSGPSFEEKLIFDFAPRQLSPADERALDRIFRLIFLLSGVSYYKAYIPQTLVCNVFPLDETTAAFLVKFYEKGLAEFAFRNGISLSGHCRFETLPAAPAPRLELDLPR